MAKKKTSSFKKKKTVVTKVSKTTPSKVSKSSSPFSKQTIEFLKTAHDQTDPKWLDRHKSEHQDLIIQPLRQTALYLLEKLSRKPEARGYKFPVRGFGRLRRSKNNVGPGESPYRNFVHLQSTRPPLSIFDENPGLYFYLSAEKSLAGGGLYEPSSRQIKKMRAWIDNDAKPLSAVLKSPGFKRVFPEGLETDKILKTFPRFYPPTHKQIEWLRLQAYYVNRPFSRKELFSSEFLDLLVESWAQSLRLNDVLSEALESEIHLATPESAPEEVSDNDLDQESSSSGDLWDDRL